MKKLGGAFSEAVVAKQSKFGSIAIHQNAERNNEEAVTVYQNTALSWRICSLVAN